MIGFLDGLRAMPKMFRQLVGGEVLSKRELPISSGVTTARLTAKRDKASGERYVILALLSSGNYQYAHLRADEFAAFAAMVDNTRRVLAATVDNGG